MAALVWFDCRFGISRLSYTLILCFLSLHLLGARYLYSYVPYDVWLERLAGVRVTELFGFTRNHYDRLVHFGFGLLILIPAFRFSRRFAGTTPCWSAAISVSLLISASACYEVFEWFAAVTMAPDWADSYNGQQGDPWDAQADMLMAIAGAGFGTVMLFLFAWPRDETAPRKT